MSYPWDDKYPKLFDSLVAWGQGKRAPEAEALFQIIDRRVGMVPTKHNLQALNILAMDGSGGWAIYLRGAVESILRGDKEIKRSFRFRYGGDALGPDRTTTYGKISATSCLFSEIRQALHYDK